MYDPTVHDGLLSLISKHRVTCFESVVVVFILQLACVDFVPSVMAIGSFSPPLTLRFVQIRNYFTTCPLSMPYIYSETIVEIGHVCSYRSGISCI